MEQIVKSMFYFLAVALPAWLVIMLIVTFIGYFLGKFSLKRVLNSKLKIEERFHTSGYWYSAILFIASLMYFPMIVISIVILLFVILLFMKMSFVHPYILLLFFVSVYFLYKILRSLFPQKRVISFKIKVERSRDDYVWAITDRISEKMNISSVDEIFISPDNQTGIYVENSFKSFFTGKRYVALILSWVHVKCLSQEELGSVIAHELGHLMKIKNPVERFIQYVLSSVSSLVKRMKDDEADYFYNLVWQASRMYAFIVFFISNGHRRLWEYRADYNAINIFGAQVHKSALHKVNLTGFNFNKNLVSNIDEMIESSHRKRINNPYVKEDLMNFDNDRCKSYEQSLVQDKTGIFYTHPAFTERLQFADSVRREKSVYLMVERNYDDEAMENEFVDLYSNYYRGYKY